MIPLQTSVILNQQRLLLTVDFETNKCRWLKLTVNQVSVAQTCRCLQARCQGSNPADDQQDIRRPTACFAVEFNLTPKSTREDAHTLFAKVFIVNNLDSKHNSINTINAASTY